MSSVIIVGVKVDCDFSEKLTLKTKYDEDTGKPYQKPCTIGNTNISLGFESYSFPSKMTKEESKSLIGDWKNREIYNAVRNFALQAEIPYTQGDQAGLFNIDKEYFFGKVVADSTTPVITEKTIADAVIEVNLLLNKIDHKLKPLIILERIS